MAEENGNNKTITILLAIIITFATIAIIYVNLPQETTKDDNIEDENPEETYLTVVYGDEQVTYSLSELESLETITGMGGFRTSYPSIKGQGTYTGVPVTALVELSAGLITDYNLTIYSDEDGEIDSATYTYDMIQGNLDIYNSTNASDENPISIGGVTMIVCYKADGEYLDESKDGKLKIAFVNEDEELITKASLWWRFIYSIEIIKKKKKQPQPFFS